MPIHNLKIVHDESARQFYTLQKNKKALLQYSIPEENRILDYSSTFVPPELRGQNIGHQLVVYALDYAAKHHFKVIPSCPFVRKIMEEDGKYRNLIAKEY